MIRKDLLDPLYLPDRSTSEGLLGGCVRGRPRSRVLKGSGEQGKAGRFATFVNNDHHNG